MMNILKKKTIGLLIMRRKSILKITEMTFARAIKTSRQIKSQEEGETNEKDKIENVRKNYEHFTITSQMEQEKKVDTDITEENFFEHSVKREITNINILVKQFYQRGKLFAVSVNKIRNSGINENIKEDYEFIRKNLRSLKKDQLLLFIKGVLYYEIKDVHFLEVLSKFSDSCKSLDSAFCILYSFAKLDYLNYLKAIKNLKKIETYNTLFNKSIEILDITNIAKSEKNLVIPIIWSLSELNFFKQELYEKIDEFVILNHDLLNEYEISIIFRAYSKVFYYKQNVLEKLISRCLQFCENMSLRYIIIVTKCLAELSIKNLNLLSGINDRLIHFLEHENDKNFDKENKVTCDDLAQILNSFVKLDFIDFKNYQTLENLFFEKLANGGLKNKESIFSILNAHMVYFRRMYNTVNEKSKDNEKNEKNKKTSFLKQRREILNENENFFDKFSDYLMKYKETLNFKTALNVIILAKKTYIYKRKNLRKLNEFYIFVLNRFLNPNEVKHYSVDEIDKFMTIGFGLFENNLLRENIIKAFNENKLNVEKFILEDKNKEKNETKDDQSKSVLENETNKIENNNL